MFWPSSVRSQAQTTRFSMEIEEWGSGKVPLLSAFLSRLGPVHMLIPDSSPRWPSGSCPSRAPRPCVALSLLLPPAACLTPPLLPPARDTCCGPGPRAESRNGPKLYPLAPPWLRNLGQVTSQRASISSSVKWARMCVWLSGSFYRMTGSEASREPGPEQALALLTLTGDAPRGSHVTGGGGGRRCGGVGAATGPGLSFQTDRRDGVIRGLRQPTRGPQGHVVLPQGARPCVLEMVPAPGPGDRTLPPPRSLS